eukprot:1247001-Ditylum_brightwellii.AAC.1
MGLPMCTRSSLARSSVAVADTVASVGPYRFRNLHHWPHRRTSSIGHASPPTTISLSASVSTSSGCRMASAAGGMSRMVT